MSNPQPKTTQKQAPTPRQMEIKRLKEKGRNGRSDQESARLDQLKKDERRERFLRLASKRVNNALRYLNNVARMANKSVYDYSPDEGAKIVQAVEYATSLVHAAFSHTKNETPGFTL